MAEITKKLLKEHISDINSSFGMNLILEDTQLHNQSIGFDTFLMSGTKKQIFHYLCAIRCSINLAKRGQIQALKA